ncbi:MAG: hypothetical protein B9J98_01650 [Candidatus Terraquivivens tikiterensis]|uniref:Molybdate ABC transporter substrate-binding protein n=1 Tax=Candidatus Terraquivivens tikiterensis TaxID=1980982 RepID=A0A2R7YB51_9ARCH|nr:MAG: hypothetical protein B9J98_01650 [Candidatus Terraquivivens tikiterensis]
MVISMSYKSKMLIVFPLTVLALGVVGTVAFYQLYKNPAREIVVFAGAAAAPVYREAASVFESRYGVKVTINLGGSGSLLSAMEITRIGDVYIPGTAEYLILANEKGIVNFTSSPPRIIAYLVLAIIVQKGNPLNITSIEDLAKPGIRVGIADPKSVCIGAYAKELLEKMDFGKPSVKI